MHRYVQGNSINMKISNPHRLSTIRNFVLDLYVTVSIREPLNLVIKVQRERKRGPVRFRAFLQRNGCRASWTHGAFFHPLIQTGFVEDVFAR